MTVTAVGTWSVRADFFDFNLKYLYLVGLWPMQEWSLKKRLLYGFYNYFLLILAFIYILITVLGMYSTKEDAIVLLTNIDKTIVAYNFIFKVIVFIWNRRYIRILINDILHSGDQITEKRKNMMTYHVVVITALITTIAGGFQMLAQIKGEIPVNAWFPFDPYKNMYMLVLANQIIVILFLVPFNFRAISIQGLVCSIVMYTCDQLIELQERLKALNYTKENEASTREEFKKIIQKHIRIMRYSKSMKDSFKEYFLIQNLAIIAELCLNALMMVFVGLEQKKLLITFMAFLIVALCNAYIFCHLGNELMDQSAGIAQAAYETDWTSWPLDMQKDLLIVITVAQRSFSLSAGGMTNMSMQSFAEALYNGYSVFAVLKDAVN